MKKNAGYIIKHDDKVIMLTKAYAKQSSVPGTKEFRELAKLHKTFPGYEIVMRTATVKEGKEVKDKKTGEKHIRAPYGKTKSWFLKKVPNYQNIDFSQSASTAEDNND